MQVLNDLLGSEDCAPDGSMGRNPITSLANGLLNTFTDQSGQRNGEEYESAPYVPSNNEMHRAPHPHRSEHEWMPDFHAMERQRHHSMMSDAWHRNHMPPPHHEHMIMEQMWSRPPPMMHHASVAPSSPPILHHQDEVPNEPRPDLDDDVQQLLEEAWNADALEGTPAQLETFWNGLINGDNRDDIPVGDALEEAWSRPNPTTTASDEAWESISRSLESTAESYRFNPMNPHLHDAAALIRGMEAFELGDIHQAILYFEAAIQQDETDEAWRLLGRCYAELDIDKLAIQCFRRAVEVDPYNLNALLYLGTSYVNEMDSIGALNALRAWVTHNPRFQGLHLQPDEYSDGSIMDSVVQLMHAALDVAPNDADVLEVLGVLYNVTQDYDAAVECFRKVLQTRPNDYALWNKIGATLANSSRSNEAIRYYSQALSLRPHYARGWLNLGISYSNLDEQAEAIKAYLQSLVFSPQAHHIWGYLRCIFTFQERYQLAELTNRQDVTLLAAELGLSEVLLKQEDNNSSINSSLQNMG